ncbi:hypothetical protein RSAG8_13404, partial [Rhizoctonia solani AG-8 WAC10335]
MDNGHLRQFLSRRHDVDRYLLGSQIAEAVSWLHEAKIVHGDIMGENIFISEDYTPKITNFGSSVVQDHALEFLATSHFGERSTSIRWKAPEVIEGRTGDTVEADIYALGMTILETLTGTPPYNEVTQDMVVLRNIIGGVCPARSKVYLPVTNIQADAVWLLLLHCWAPDPLTRPSAFDVRHRMREIALARLPNSHQDQVNRGLLSDDQLLVLNSLSYYDLEIPHANTPNFLYMPAVASAPLSRPSRNHSDTDCHDLQSNKGSAQTKGSVMDTPTVIHSEMTIEEILKHLTDHGCNNITRELGDCQCEYPVSTGGYGDIYRGTLSDGKEVGLKCIRLLFDSSDKGRKKLLEGRTYFAIYLD